MTDFLEVRTAGSITEVEARLEAALKERKFGTLHVHDLMRTLQSKGIAFDTPLLVMDICNPGHAQAALAATANRIAPLLPCSVALWQDGGEVVVRLLKPTALARFFADNAALARTSVQVEAGIVEAIGAVTGGVLGE